MFWFGHGLPVDYGVATTIVNAGGGGGGDGGPSLQCPPARPFRHCDPGFSIQPPGRSQA